MDPYLCFSSKLYCTYIDSWALWNPFSPLPWCFWLIMALTQYLDSMRLHLKQLRRFIILKAQLSKTIVTGQSLPLKIKLLFFPGVRAFLFMFYCNHDCYKWKVLLQKWKIKAIGLCFVQRMHVFVPFLFPLAQFLRQYWVQWTKPRVILAA